MRDVCKRGEVTVKPSHVISHGSAVNISCSLKPKQGCLYNSSVDRLILYKYGGRISSHQGHSLSSQVTDLPLGKTLFVCKLACTNSEIRICGAEISVGGLLAPHEVSANSEGIDKMVVTWQPPRKAASAVREYVVEWRELHPGTDTQPPLNWLRRPPSSLSALISENIKPYVCYEIRVCALSGDQGGCSSILGNSKHKAPLSGPQINAITEEKGSVLISWNNIPAQEHMGCILRYRIYWKERDSDAQPQFCGKANGNAYVASSVCIAVIMVGIFSVRYFRQKSQSWSPKIPDPANSTWAKKYPTVEEKTQLPLERLLTAWSTPEEPEPLIINEVLHQVVPVFRHPQHPNFPEGRQGVQGHEEDTVSNVSDPSPPGALMAETRKLVNLYKVLGSRSPDSKPAHPAHPVTVLAVDYLPTYEGYLPSNRDDLPSREASLTDPPEELEPQHIAFSVFPSSSLHPLTFSCGEKLTLDRLKMGCDSLML
ncbi:Interleukin-12 receptor subunit beta-2 [Tupaia chinensis]|uniref:Interleukin-12 receptor subunit beta-2 n=1 Tax=Tupaia chinensis TaxID=246437 RepID=L8Y366_TUPCH|nr:Interleukin-12 receptor subunit beta-2 [Tupaia chinensis]